MGLNIKEHFQYEFLINEPPDFFWKFIRFKMHSLPYEREDLVYHFRSL